MIQTVQVSIRDAEICLNTELMSIQILALFGFQTFTVQYYGCLEIRTSKIKKYGQISNQTELAQAVFYVKYIRLVARKRNFYPMVSKIRTVSAFRHLLALTNSAITTVDRSKISSLFNMYSGMLKSEQKCLPFPDVWISDVRFSRSFGLRF